LKTVLISQVEALAQMKIQNLDLWAHYMKSSEREALPWTTEEEAIVHVGVGLYGSNHATAIFEVFRHQLQSERTQEQLTKYLVTTFGKEYHRNDAMQEARTILRYVAIQLI